MIRLTPDLLIRAYAGGIFPMAEAGDSDEIFWVDPKERGILPLDSFHISHRLRRTLHADRFEIFCDRDFTATMRGCAEATENRPSTWINDELVAAYSELHRRGLAHSVEAWLGGELAGGLYGVALGGAFFGESMFSRATDASKIALAHLVARLRHGGFTLLDTQFVTAHLKQFGAVTVTRASYRRMLEKALVLTPHWPTEAMPGAAIAELLPKETGEIRVAARG